MCIQKHTLNGYKSQFCCALIAVKEAKVRII